MALTGDGRGRGGPSPPEASVPAGTNPDAPFENPNGFEKQLTQPQRIRSPFSRQLQEIPPPSYTYHKESPSRIPSHAASTSSDLTAFGHLPLKGKAFRTLPC